MTTNLGGFRIGDHVVTTGGAAPVDDDDVSVYSDFDIHGGGNEYGVVGPGRTECFTHALLKAVALAAVVVLIIMVMCRMAGSSKGSSKGSPKGSSKALVKHLADCGWVVYYRRGCGHCTKQKEVLGGNYKKYIECDANGVQLSGYTTKPPVACNSPQIKGFPFWYNTKTGDTRLGFQGIGGDLQAMAQC